MQLESYLKEAETGFDFGQLVEVYGRRWPLVLQVSKHLFDTWQAKPEDRSADPEWMEKCMQFCSALTLAIVS